MSKFDDYFRYTSELLQTRYEQSQAIDHNLTAGEVRELFVEEFLSDMYPEQFVFGDGEIIDSSGRVSPQADLVVYDQQSPLLTYGGSNHFLAEGVLAHLEIKSDLTSSVDDVLTKTEGVKELNKNWVENTREQIDLPHVFSGAFAFEGPSPETLLRQLCEFYDIEVLQEGEQSVIETGDYHWGEVIDVICVLGEYVFFKHTSLDRQGNPTTTMQLLDTGEDSLSGFFVFLAGSIYRGMAGRPDLRSYMSMGEYDAFELPD
ncbi:hypothetical protein Huta_0239 [Halorhabdus utahensis DSM 12940]|uniref:DUF6602 domain-containing protein n=1 Tax=Halorhabdus utahensis (strain DSM 12940 / JCM 11049 / AX-2) TaxID=519442 RepID=C7NPY0_HALUD|nr:DUF6602 domain-containing protein [Halorhabdus utahensis]ACV10427.1 hypothetical protein Huta_0239 [Halorhabdus utahensis DSM 12940]